MKKRNEVDPKEIWAIEDLYATDEAFYADIKKLAGMADEFKKNFQDLKTADDVYKSLEAYAEISGLTDRLGTFSGISKETDATDDAMAKRDAKFGSEYAKIAATLSFYDSALVKVDPQILDTVAKDHPGYEYYLKRVKDEAKYLLDEKTEAALAALAPTFDAPYVNYNDMRYGDMKFENITHKGEEVVLNHNTFEEYLEGETDTELRRKAFADYHKVLGAYQNADASVYNTLIQNEKIMADLRGYKSVFHYLLARQDVDFDIYENHIDIIMEKLAPIMRKYATIIKNHYGLEEMTYADLKLAIDPEYEPQVSIDQARDYIVDGLSPLGEEYIGYMKKAFADKWIDYSQNIGKRTGAFCASPYGSHPFIMTTYNNSMSQVMTLAHELGHAGQGILSNDNQNALSNDMSMYFVEAPSTANEITMERYLLKKAEDDREKLWVLATMIGKTYYHNFVTHYLEAAFQREVYRRVDRGESLGAEDFNSIFKEKLEQFWGDAVKLNEGAELTWMRQPHYYMGLYSFTYQAGLTVGTAISEKIVHGTEEDRKTWLEVLKMGGSRGPIELAKAAGVDMSTTKPIEDAIDFIGEIVDQIDELMGKLDMYK
ncbi:oligoendopeptidase F [uncultured Anaerococcus sp.]|uniref:oligoendopeptidase F n=1 Tax=uncultured Anaerococcus sp. TaxID=293428 RepID=UPI00261959C7|nr:oligoendopeptidase F [uncultured Anaerococcus sp.]